MLGEPLSLAEKVGLCQWFHFQDDGLLEATLETLPRLGVRHLRTGLSWADYHRPGGREWYDHQMAALRDADVEVLLSVWHTPPSISMAPGRGSSSAPPREPRRYADFLDTVIGRWGDAFTHVELWNEPNNPYKWDGRYDPDYRIYAELVVDAGHWARQRGKVPVLGGVALLDQDFLYALREHGALDFVDIVGAHGFPGMWEPYATDWEHPHHWFGWTHRVDAVSRAAGDMPVWITEAGTASRRKDDGSSREQEQAERLRDAIRAPAGRVYWYSLFDLDPARLAIEESQGGPREEAEYHMGLVRFDPDHRVEGFEKPAFHALRRALKRDAAVGRGAGDGPESGRRSGASEVELGPLEFEEPVPARAAPDA